MNNIENCHLMEIERCFVLNLKDSAERWQRMCGVTKNFPFAVERMDAVLGKDIVKQHEDIKVLFAEDVVAKSATHFCRVWDSMVNDLGCFHSHIRAWKRMVKDRIKAALIVEDHVAVVWEPTVLIDNSYDISFVNSRFRREGVELKGVGGSAYVLTLRGAQLLCKWCIPIRGPIDIQLRGYCNQLEPWQNLDESEQIRWFADKTWFERTSDLKSVTLVANAENHQSRLTLNSRLMLARCGVFEVKR